VSSPSRFADPGESPGFLLWQATLRWQRELTAALKPLGLTHVQFVLLAVTWRLGRSGSRPSQREVAALARTDPMMTSQVLRTLERRGLVSRSVDPADARTRRVAATRAGERLAHRAIRVVEAADGEFFAAAPDHAAFLRALRALAASRA
jgi:DNA-binding MarR family transcriptional regulator